jgi:hypothetical protein
LPISARSFASWSVHAPNTKNTATASPIDDAVRRIRFSCQLPSPPAPRIAIGAAGDGHGALGLMMRSQEHAGLFGEELGVSAVAADARTQLGLHLAAEECRLGFASYDCYQTKLRSICATDYLGVRDDAMGSTLAASDLCHLDLLNFPARLCVAMQSAPRRLHSLVTRSLQ